MATTKSKSTKTTKKPVKALKKTAKTAKTVTKKTELKSEAVKTTVTTRSTAARVLSPLERIRSLHISSALVYSIFAGVVIGFAVTGAVAVKLGIQARDQFAGGDTVVLGPASEVLYNIEPKFVLAAALIVSAVFSVLAASKLRGRYEATVTNGTSGLRWVALGISAALTLTFINLLAGIDDAATLKLSAFMIIGTTMLSFLAERENTGAVRPKWLAFDLSLLAGAVAWLPLLGTFIGTAVYGTERFGWHVYALAAVTLVGFTGLAINQYRHLRAAGQTDYPRIEERYLRIDMLTKFAVVIIVLLALK